MDQSRYFVERLLILLTDTSKSSKSDILKKWRSLDKSDTWRDKLIEALCIIQAKKILSKLNLNENDLTMTYLPHIRDRGLLVHRVVKLLYYVCEQLIVSQAFELIEQVEHEYPRTKLDNFPNCDGKYLELRLLHWIVERVIDVGVEKPGSARLENGQLCNLNPILKFLKQNDMHSLKDKAQDAVDTFNQSRANNTTDKEHVNSLQSNSNSIGFGERQRGNSECLSDDAYVIRKKHAGIVLIINQMEFHRSSDPDQQKNLAKFKLHNRDGTNKDKKALEETFFSYGYTIWIRENLPHNEILASVREVVHHSVQVQCDSVVVCILSHGNKGTIVCA